MSSSLDFQRQLELLIQTYEKEKQILLKKATLTNAQFLLLSEIENGTHELSQLEEHLQLDKSTISRQVKQMVQLGLLEKLKSEEDYRSFTILLTNLGRKKYFAVKHPLETSETIIFTGWSVEEKQLLIVLLKRLIRSLNKLP